MILTLLKKKVIRDLQKEFSNAYPYLKLEFYKTYAGPVDPLRDRLTPSTLLEDAGLKEDGTIAIDGDLTVRQLEKKFKHDHGLLAQVSRRSGMLWLETTMTDSLTLEKQNEHGREISLTPNLPPTG